MTKKKQIQTYSWMNLQYFLDNFKIDSFFLNFCLVISSANLLGQSREINAKLPKDKASPLPPSICIWSIIQLLLNKQLGHGRFFL